MENLDALDLAHGGPLWVAVGGEVHLAPAPADLPWQILLLTLHAEHVPDMPDMALWRTNALFKRWVAHYDLPTHAQAMRLSFLLDRYYPQLEADLHPRGTDIGALWRARDWRRLLNLIDHLPRNTYYSEKMTNDEEYAKAMAEAQAEQQADGGSAKRTPPPMHSWSFEAGMLAEIIDAIHALDHTTKMVASNGKGPKAPEPYLRPQTAFADATRAAVHARKKKRHEALTKRILPHKR